MRKIDGLKDLKATHKLVAYFFQQGRWDLVSPNVQMLQRVRVKLDNLQEFRRDVGQVEGEEFKAEGLKTTIRYEAPVNSHEVLLLELVHVPDKEGLQLWQGLKHISEVDRGHVYQSQVLGPFEVQCIDGDLVKGAAIEFQVDSLIELKEL